MHKCYDSILKEKHGQQYQHLFFVSIATIKKKEKKKERQKIESQTMYTSKDVIPYMRCGSGAEAVRLRCGSGNCDGSNLAHRKTNAMRGGGKDFFHSSMER